MNEYIQIEFTGISAELNDLLIAELSENGFEGFEETRTGLKAFIPAKEYDGAMLERIAKESNTSFTKTVIQETNWNEVWESNFDPVIIDDFAAIRADFHAPITTVSHEIVITPKMSFGTGHHATTYMMIEQMKQIDFTDKIVLDFGTGTGVLAILAEKLGAKEVIAIDNDDWSIENAGENILKNNCSHIGLRKEDTADVNQSFDIILANINKNVIVDNLNILNKQLKKEGNLLLSGLLITDEDDIFRRMVEYSLQLKQTAVRDKWLCLRFSC